MRSPEEWLKQSDYDLGTAESMFQSGRYFYAVFMAHLSLEKALKGLYQQRMGVVPPKTHDLLWLLDKMSVMPPPPVKDPLVRLNTASVVTRYPEDLEEIKRQFTAVITRGILDRAQECLEWIRRQF